MAVFGSLAVVAMVFSSFLLIAIKNEMEYRISLYFIIPTVSVCCLIGFKDCANRRTISRLLRNDVDLGVFQGRKRFLPSRQRNYVTL
eukprot:3798114-Amphidinium_carterae.1